MGHFQFTFNIILPVAGYECEPCCRTLSRDHWEHLRTECLRDIWI